MLFDINLDICTMQVQYFQYGFDHFSDTVHI